MRRLLHGGQMMITIELSPPQRTEIERIIRTGARPLARRARIVLTYADGGSLGTIAARARMHRDSCRRWLLRYRAHGLAGLQHGNTGRPKNVVFDAATRGEIGRRAGLNPGALGEAFTEWSLYKLRDHLVRRGVVHSISVERLRQLLRDSSVDRRYWHESICRVGSLTPGVRRQLLQLARHPQANRARRARVILALVEGTSVAHIARDLHIGKNSIQRWVEHFRLAGVSGLSLGVATLNQAIVRLTRVPPRAVGAAGDAWSAAELHALLRRQGVAPVIGVNELRRVAAAAGIPLVEHEPPHDSAFGFTGARTGGADHRVRP